MLTQKQIKELLMLPLEYEQSGAFIHCKHCLEKFLNSEEHKTQSAQEYMAYEISSYPFKLKDKTSVNALVIWCKRCHRQVWDSRHLTPIEL